MFFMNAMGEKWLASDIGGDKSCGSVVRCRQGIAEDDPNTVIHLKGGHQFPKPIGGYLAVIIREGNELALGSADRKIPPHGKSFGRSP
jgi:hypothetical protein